MSTLLLQSCRSRAQLYHSIASLTRVSLSLQLPETSVGHVGFATASASDQQQQQHVTLKSVLRQLYKRVHPDLFTDFPAEQAENERSFKLLQDYLHQARTPTPGPASRTAYHFRFYLMPQPSDAEPDADASCLEPQLPAAAAAAAAGPTAPTFQEVTLSLVPPQPSTSGQGLSAAALKALGKLLLLCGLPDVSAAEGEEQVDTAKQLSTFLPEAAELVRQHESGPALDEVRVANIRAAMRLAHQVKASFQPGMFKGPQQVELLQRLAEAMGMLAGECQAEGCDLDLAGLHILICSKTALDSLGTLCLDAQDSSEDWADFLGGVDVDYARNKAAAAAALRQLESNVAAAVGVRMLFTAAHYLATHEYRSCLERLAAHAAEHGPVQPSTQRSQHSSSSSSDAGVAPPELGSRDIPVYVAPPQSHMQWNADRQQQQQQQPVHELQGHIMVYMDDSAQHIYSTIQQYGAAAVAILTKKQQLQQELAQVTAAVRKRLGLRRLFKDELITADEYKSACRRLLQHKELLQQCHIEGLSIRVSDGNRVAPDGSVVDIAWNFEL